MTADLLSLSKHRKAKEKAAKEQRASENRVLFGLTKAEKQQRATELAQARGKIEAHRLDTPASKDD
ncbi:MAG: DUF4169 family protein [Beijerinckiaceae bacterium]